MAEFKDIRKILVIKLRHIGDVLLTTPAIRALKNTFPHACITALVNLGTEDVLTGNPLIHEIFTLDRSVLNYRGQGSGVRGQENLYSKRFFLNRIRYELSFVKKIRERHFDMAVDLTGGDRPALYSFLSGARYRIGYEQAEGFAGKRFLYTHRFNIDRDRHTVLQNLELLSKTGIQPSAESQRPLAVDFYISKHDEDWLNNVLMQRGIKEKDIIVHIHPTSRWFFKCWKDEYMADVIDRVQKKYGANVFMTCSPDEREMDKANRIIELAKNKPIAFIGDITLKKLGAISKRAKLFFGVDSAPMHIAAVVGTPVVALFGPSGAFQWGPWDNSYRGQGARGKGQEEPYQERNGVQTFGRHTVIQRDWECIPCGKDGCDGSKISDCLEDIGVDEVMAVVGKYLGGPPIESFGDRSY
ncbi:MAG: putative lipopolysaccharide heptosyltransferase III [Deltaproteobacteria bacterium]|nr:putative lipopolysaccharide heptosyltransferase III [Deltaproteobacteria bacterium]MBI3755816.1 putative lipopolysaccharide heptosyltransferase III [Deltaproteobacteria bacterium]